MSNGFRVEPTYVAGYRELCSDTAADCRGLASFVRTEADSDELFTGLVMSNLSDLVDAYATATADRLVSRADTLYTTSVELRDTAWQYVDEDNWQARMWGGFDIYTGLVENEFPGGTVAYDREDVVGQLQAPAVDEDGGRDYVMEDAGTELTTINEVVGFITGLLDVEFDPVGLVLDPLTGNWNSLDQKGQVLVIAGDASETAADNLTNAVPTLLSEWEGGAAVSFEGYLTDYAAALRYDGPLNRVVGEVYMVVANIIKETARTAIGLIGDLVTRLRQYATGTRLWEMGGEIAVDIAESVWGVFTGGNVENPLNAIRELWEELRDMYDDAVALVDSCRTSAATSRRSSRSHRTRWVRWRTGPGRRSRRSWSRSPSGSRSWRSSARRSRLGLTLPRTSPI